MPSKAHQAANAARIPGSSNECWESRVHRLAVRAVPAGGRQREILPRSRISPPPGAALFATLPHHPIIDPVRCIITLELQRFVWHFERLVGQRTTLHGRLPGASTRFDPLSGCSGVPVPLRVSATNTLRQSDLREPASRALRCLDLPLQVELLLVQLRVRESGRER